MPAPFPTRQPAEMAATAAMAAWFAGAAGQAVLDSEAGAVREALDERPGQPWLWIRAVAATGDAPGRGVRLALAGDAWGGDLRCGSPLPISSESVGTVVLQHVGDLPLDVACLLRECARVLVPGGRAWLFALNPLTPYRRHWWGTPLVTSEPLTWRRRMRVAGLEPEPVSTGIGPRWNVACTPDRQDGPGLRAAWALRARKRVAAAVPPSPVAALRWQPGSHSVMPWRTYCESVWSTTVHPSVSVSSAMIAAINSIRLLVVAASPPASSRSRAP